MEKQVTIKLTFDEYTKVCASLVSYARQFKKGRARNEREELAQKVISQNPKK